MTKANSMHVIQNVQLEVFEKAVYSRDYEQASIVLLENLRKLKTGAEFIGYSTDPRIKVSLHTRFCAALVTLLLDPGFNLSQDGFDYLASEHAITDTLFRISAFETSDHMLPQLSANPSETDRTKLVLGNGASLIKFLVVYSLRSGFALNFEGTFKKAPRETFSLYNGMLGTLLAINKQAQDRREQLLGLHHIFKDITPSVTVLPTLADAYMYTSYGLRRDKHGLKGTIHRMFSNMFKKQGVKLPTPQELQIRRNNLNGRDKPVMLVCNEWFTSLHAMYRCYAPIIRSLKSKFYIIGMSRRNDIDEIGIAEFDEWREIPEDNLDLSSLIEHINEIAPDMIYYPSIGMSIWWVALASVRLAPVQVMTLGHPASSYSPAIDFVICEEGSIGAADLFTEKIYQVPGGSGRFLMRSDAPEFGPAINNITAAEFSHDPMTFVTPKIIHVAIPAMLCKLNATFMASLSRINEECGKRGKEVQFHFFVNMMGSTLYQASREIRAWLPTALIYARTSYDDYLSSLSKCHVHLSTFPFGGTNSNIDSLLLGIPVLTLLGDEPHERFDALMIERVAMHTDSDMCVDMVNSCIAHSIGEYEKNAVNMITDDDFRLHLRTAISNVDIKAEFFNPVPELDNQYLEAFNNIYKYLETYNLTSKQLITYRDKGHPL